MDTKPGHFNFFAAANDGYKTLWLNRTAIAKLAFLPLMVKFGCLAAIIFLGMEGQILRHGLIMIPSYFAEGFLIAYIIRVLHSSGDLQADVREAHAYFEDIKAAMIAFILVQLALAFIVGYTMSQMPEMPIGEAQNTMPTNPSMTSQSFLAVTSMLVFIIWAFRFAWLHIPLAMGIPLNQFIQRISSFSSSFPMLGCWLICFIPVVCVMVIASRFALVIFPQVEGAHNTLSDLILFMLQGGFETVINILSAIAISYGFKALMEQK